MKYVVAISLLAVSGYAAAKEPTSLGDGRYMLSDQNLTIFGSTDKIVAKLMKQAETFCQAKTGLEAVMLQSDGSEAVPGAIGSNGMLQRGARGATGTVYFQCGAPEAVASVSDNAAAYEALAKLKTLLDSGAITQAEFETEKKKLLGN